MRIILVFIDGLGIGTRGPHNPLDDLGDAAIPLAVFRDEELTIPYGGLLVRTDACLGVEGRPQSASGQTTILTGINAPAILGYHKQGFPNQTLREIIREHSIFLKLKQLDTGPNAFANAYSPRFFQERPRWVSATTVAVEAAEIPFRTIEDIRSGRALYHDFTNNALIETGTEVPRRTPMEAAEILAELAANHRFTLYEYFITDRAGHMQDSHLARDVLSNLATFVRTLIDKVDLSSTTIVLTSDHGNVEDLSSKNHTRNEVPTLIWGAAQISIAARLRNLADITPAIIYASSEMGGGLHASSSIALR